MSDVSLNHIEFWTARIIMMHLRELIVSNSFETSGLFMRYMFFIFYYGYTLDLFTANLNILSTFSRSLDACICVEQCVLRACSRHHRFKGPWTVPIEGQGRLKLSSTWGGWKMQMSSHFRRTWIFVLCPMR